ncbi:MAG TPA: hypothetical protein VJJ77_06620 [Dongiaceae bacterium]|nr:hypothetical protein [Dongiaceae bacterium]
MAFKSRELSVLAYANGFTLWHYRTEDAPETVVDVAGYFDSACDMLRGGDQIIVNLLGQSRPAIVNLVVTAAGDAVAVGVAPAAAVTPAGPSSRA